MEPTVSAPPDEFRSDAVQIGALLAANGILPKACRPLFPGSRSVEWIWDRSPELVRVLEEWIKHGIEPPDAELTRHRRALRLMAAAVGGAR